MISLHTTATFPGKVKVHLRRLSMRVYCVWMGLANSLLRAGGRGTRQRTLAYSSENAPATPARVNRNTMFRISSGRSVCNQLLDADRTPKPRGNFRRQTSPASGRLKLRNISSVSSEFNSSDHRLKFYLCSCTAWSVSACFLDQILHFGPVLLKAKYCLLGLPALLQSSRIKIHVSTTITLVLPNILSISAYYSFFFSSSSLMLRNCTYTG